jgi:hypothetical protein
MQILTNQIYKVALGWRRAMARAQGVRLERRVMLATDIDFNLSGTFKNCLRNPNAKGTISLGAGAWIERGAVLWAFDGSIRTERNVYLGPYVTIYGHGGVTIGADTLVSMKATILSSNHAIPPLNRKIREERDELLPTKIGCDVWIGANAVILGGVTIGDGAVVAAGAVVSSDVQAGAVVAGVPARFVRRRIGKS